MRRFISIATLIDCHCLAGQSAMAQSFKFGHINSDELIQAMPEYDSATVKAREIP